MEYNDAEHDYKEELDNLLVDIALHFEKVSEETQQVLWYDLCSIVYGFYGAIQGDQYEFFMIHYISLVKELKEKLSEKL